MLALALYANRPRTRQLLVRFLYRRVRDPNIVEDLLQNIDFRLLRTPEDVEAKIQTPDAYLYGIARHVLADYRVEEKQREERVIIDQDTVDDYAQKFPYEAPDYAEELGLRQIIQRNLEKMPPTHAAVLMAHKYEGLSYDEVAERLGLSIHTVEKYVTQALRGLREMDWDDLG